jgi:hypothetical protein
LSRFSRRQRTAGRFLASSTASSFQSDAPENYQPGTKPEDAAQFDMFVGKDDADSFLEEYEEALKFKPDFHNQLKARLLKHQIITQILQEDTLSGCLKTPEEMPARDMEDPATTTWNLTTSISEPHAASTGRSSTSSLPETGSNGTKTC